MGHPHRWAILSHLAHSDQRVGELTQLIGQPQNLVSYHLRELRDAGLVSSRRSSFDGRDTYYRVDLDRCGALFCETAAALHPALRFAPTAVTLPTGRAGGRHECCSCAPATAPGPRWRRRCSSITPPRHPGAQRGQPPQAAASQRRAGDGRARHRHLRQHHQASPPIRPQPLRPRGHAVRQGPRGLPRVPGRAGHDPLEHARPRRRGLHDEETYPAFERTAEELETRVRHLIAQLSTPRGGTTHAR